MLQSPICSRCTRPLTRSSALPVSARSLSRKERGDLASEKRKTRWDSARHSWPNCCSRTAACREQPFLGEKVAGLRSSVARWLGSEPVSWRPASAQCDDSLSAASNTLGGASNSGRRSVSSNQWPTASLYMKLRYETARLLFYKVGWLMQNEQSADMDAAMAKLYVLGSFVNSFIDTNH